MIDDDVLAFEPFEGDFGTPDDRVFSNKMVIARKEGPCAHGATAATRGQTKTTQPPQGRFFNGAKTMECAVLDPCCGSRMMWFDKADPRAIFGDQRSETITVTDNSRGNASGTRTLRIEPDSVMDFRALPFSDSAFKLVAFDPPHLLHAGPRSWLAAKYGRLGKDWRDDIRLGFTECWRVLASDGVLVFKWNETQVKVSEVLALAPAKPLFGQVSGRAGMTHWLVFMKP